MAESTIQVTITALNKASDTLKTLRTQFDNLKVSAEALNKIGTTELVTNLKTASDAAKELNTQLGGLKTDNVKKELRQADTQVKNFNRSVSDTKLENLQRNLNTSGRSLNKFKSNITKAQPTVFSNTINTATQSVGGFSRQLSTIDVKKPSSSISSLEKSVANLDALFKGFDTAEFVLEMRVAGEVIDAVKVDFVELGQVVNKMAIDFGKLATSAGNLSRSLSTVANKNFGKLISQLEILDAELRSVVTSGAGAAGSLGALAGASGAAAASTSGLNTRLGNSAIGLTRTANASTAVGRGFARLGNQSQVLNSGLTQLGAAISIPFALAAVSLAKFEKELSAVEAILGGNTTEQDLRAMREEAQRLGIATEFSASQAAGALRFLAQAGFDARQSTEALAGTLQLASAGELDLARAADIATNVLTAFRLNVSELGRVNDTLAKTASSSNTNIEELAEAMKFAAPAAAASGVEVEELAAAIGRLADNGIKGSNAGTGLRAILIRLQRPVGAAAETLDRLGVQTRDAGGNFRGLTTILRELNQESFGLTESELIFGRYASSAGVAAVASADAIQSLREANEAAFGFAQTVQDIKLDNLAGDFRKLISAIEGLGNAIASTFNDDLRNKIQDITQSIRQLTRDIENASPATKELIKSVADFGVTLLKIAAAVFIFRKIAGVFVFIRNAGRGLVGFFSKGLDEAIKKSSRSLGSFGATKQMQGFIRAEVIVKNLLKTIARGAVVFQIFSLASEVHAALVRKEFNELSEAARILDANLKKTFGGSSTDLQFKNLDQLSALSEQQLKDRKAELELSKAGVALEKESVAIRLGITAAEEFEKNTLFAINSQIELTNRALRAKKGTLGDINKENNLETIILDENIDGYERIRDVQEEISRTKFDSLVKELERTGEATAKALFKSGDILESANAFEKFYSDVTNAAKNFGEEQKNIQETFFKDQIDFLKAQELGDAAFKDQSLDAFRDFTDKVIDIEKTRLETLTDLRQSALDREKAAREELADINRTIADEELSSQRTLIGIERSGLKGLAELRSKEREDALLKDEIQKAIDAGDLQRALQLARERRRFAKQFQGEIKENGKVVVSAGTASANAATKHKEAQETVLDVLRRQAAEVKKTQQAAREDAARLQLAIVALRDTIQGIQGRSIDLEANFRGTNRAEIENFLDDVVANATDVLRGKEIKAEVKAEVDDSEVRQFKTDLDQKFSQNDTLEIDAKISESTKFEVETLETKINGIVTAKRTIQVDADGNRAFETIENISREGEVLNTEVIIRDQDAIAEIDRLTADGQKNIVQVVDDRLYQVRIANDVTRPTERRVEVIGEFGKFDEATGVAVKPVTKDVSFLPKDEQLREFIRLTEQPTAKNVVFTGEAITFDQEVDLARDEVTKNFQFLASPQEVISTTNLLTRSENKPIVMKPETEEYEKVRKDVLKKEPKVVLPGFVFNSEYHRRLRDIKKDERKRVFLDFLVGSRPGGVSIGGNADGGHITGPGTGTSDSILSRLSNGEFVMKTAAVKTYGTNFMHALNNMQLPRLPRFATGGIVSSGVQAAVAPPTSTVESVQLDLTFNGKALGPLRGNRETVQGFVTALSDLQRGIA